jgi:hypothetical protein
MPFNTREKLLTYNQSTQRRQSQKLHQRQYRQTNYDKTIKTKRMSQWRCSHNIRDVNDQMYEDFINTTHCETCKVELTTDKRTTATRKVIDHCHLSGYKRFICCTKCNNKLAGTDKLRMMVLLELHRTFNRL